MNDLISRQAAIDALMVRDKELRNINWYDKPYAEGECRGIDEALAIVSNLPSVQPETHEKRTETHACDCISREATKHLDLFTKTYCRDKISYAVICDKFPSPHIYFNTYDEAERWAKFDQPNDRPFYIVKRSEHFEIVGEVR